MAGLHRPDLLSEISSPEKLATLSRELAIVDRRYGAACDVLFDIPRVFRGLKVGQRLEN